MLFRRLWQVFVVFAFSMGFFQTPVLAAGTVQFSVMVDSKNFAATRTARVTVTASSSDPTDPIISINCQGGSQTGTNQCLYLVSANQMINTTAVTQRTGSHLNAYNMCELDSIAPNFLPFVLATDQAGSSNNIWTNKPAPRFAWMALGDPPTYCANGDPSGFRSGVQGYKVYFGSNVNGGPSDPSVVNVTSSVFDPNTPLSSGIYYLRVQPYDYMNNFGPWHTLYTYKLDTLLPTISIAPETLPDGLNGWYVNTAPSLTIQTRDLYGNIANVQTRVNGGEWDSSDQIDLSGDGTYNIDAQATDEAGNIGTGSTQIKIDRNPIAYTMVKPAIKFPVFQFPVWYTSDVTLLDKTTITRQVTDVSGVDNIQFKKDDGTWTGVAPSFTTSGKFNVDVQTRDLAGNMDSGTVTIQLDKDKPIITASLDTQNAVSAKTARLLVAASDKTSGVGSVSYKIDDRGFYLITTVNTNGDFIQDIDLSAVATGQHKITVQTTDVAGNFTTQIFMVSMVNFPIYLPAVFR